MALVSLMPPNTLITADHHLSCKKNRWSDKIRALRTHCRKQYRVDITCDGAF